MALQVWLPLNGNLNNNGLLDIIVTNHGATVENNGKIGKCYTFDNNTSYIALQHINLYSILNGAAQPFSICFWVYQADASRAIIFGDYSVSGGNNFNIELTTGHTLRWYWGTPDFSISAMNVGQEVWAHVAFTYDGTTLKGYLNGQLKYTGTWTLAAKGRTAGEYYLGRDGRTGTTTLNGRLNDFRIYNHCLSPKEVKEISKGLVAHYPFKSSTIELPSTWVNFSDLTTWNKEGSVTATWDSAANAYKIADSAHTSSRWGIYKQVTLRANTSYTFSVYGRYVDQNGGYGFAEGNSWPAVASTLTTTRTQYSKTINVGNQDITCRIYLFVNPVSGGTNYVYFDTPVLQEATQKVYDHSGNGYHGTMTGGAITASSPRYTEHLHFNATNQYVRITGLTTTGFSNSYTFSWWGKASTFSGVMQWGFSDGVRLNGIYDGKLWNTGDSSNNPLYQPGTTTQVTVPTANEWHHFAMTGNGSKCYVYKDGVLWAEAKTYKTITGTTIIFNGWDTGTSYSMNNLSISDWRLYATALSADDVKELYNTPAVIDSKQNLYTYEFVESTQNRELLNSVLITSSYGEHITPINNSKYINGELTFTTNGSSAGSPYIPITPSGHVYKYDIEFSVNAGNQFYIGFERYDQNKTSRSNNACVYVYATKPTTNLSHKRIKGTVNLSTDGTNPCAFIALRILNGWSGTDSGVTGTATIHRLSLQEVSSTVTAAINKQGICIADNIYEDTETTFYDNGYIESNQFIEY